MNSVKKPGSMLGWGLILTLAINLIIWVPGAKAAGPMEDVKSLIADVKTILRTQRKSLSVSTSSKSSPPNTWTSTK